MDEKEAKIEELCKRAVLAGLEGVEFLQGFDYAVLAREYNGIGPEWAGADIRAWVTRHAALFEPAALIHDMRYCESDGSRYNFNQANVEFLVNCLRLANLAHPWWSWKRYRARFAAHAFFDCVCGDGGWRAWRFAAEKGLKGEKEKTMKAMKLAKIILCAGVLACAGCKSIEVDRKAQSLATVEVADGKHEVVRDAAGNPIILDGGWSVDYFQHWNWQQFDALTAKAGQAELAINNYKSGADSNIVALVHTSLDGLTKLAVAVGDAYCKIAGGGAQADTALKVANKVAKYFSDKGGDVTRATVTTTADNKVQVSDGTTCVTCDRDGNCADCTPAAN